MELPATLDLPGGVLGVRRAVAADVPAVVALLADDPLGGARESTGPGEDLTVYRRAFEAVDADPSELLVVVVDAAEVVGTLRAQIEAVRVREDVRSRGVGAALFEWAFHEAHDRGCVLVQLTTDKARPAAQRFYAGLGFVASHEGLKRELR